MAITLSKKGFRLRQCNLRVNQDVADLIKWVDDFKCDGVRLPVPKQIILVVTVHFLGGTARLYDTYLQKN
jgi:glycosidase